MVRVLFLCTHNSARSILSEAVLNHLGAGRFEAFSAGSSPRANQQPNPLALQVLQESGVSIDGLSSKSWDVFAAPQAPAMDLVVTVCGNAGKEVCPVWIGHPATAHWGYDDPSEAVGGDAAKLQAFRQTRDLIADRLQRLVALPDAALSPSQMQATARALAAAP
jgi:arsenate reductase (thioredoxin)